MSCVLRVHGKHFDVDRYLRSDGALQPIAIHRKGHPFAGRPGARKLTSSALTFGVSKRGFSDFEGQVRDAIRFLTKHERAIRKLRRCPGVEVASVDFGVVGDRREPYDQYFCPEALVRIAGRLSLNVVVSDYTRLIEPVGS